MDLTPLRPRHPSDLRPGVEQPRWRRDFPIDWPEDHFVARRDFTKFLVLTSFAFVVGQVWIGILSLRRGRAPAPGAERVARVAELPVGGARSFVYDGEPALLLRLSNDEIVAYGSQCTHLQCAVFPELERGRLVCPCHHGYFDARDGHPTAGPPRRPLDRILLEVRGGWVWAVGRELRT
jgi:nitrite reductase/ring-hydroxylating ferredoxin subunit